MYLTELIFSIFVIICMAVYSAWVWFRTRDRKHTYIDEDAFNVLRLMQKRKELTPDQISGAFRIMRRLTKYRKIAKYVPDRRQLNSEQQHVLYSCMRGECFKSGMVFRPIDFEIFVRQVLDAESREISTKTFCSHLLRLKVIQ